MTRADDPTLIRSKHKPISGLIPYAIRLGQGMQLRVADLIIRASVASIPSFETPIWRRVQPYITTLFEEPTPSMNGAIVRILPYMPWDDELQIRWVAAVSATSYTEDLCPSVVDTLLRVAHTRFLRHIPIDVWAWLKRRPSLPPQFQGRIKAYWDSPVYHIRGLGDTEILKSYFLLIWSEWNTLFHNGPHEMEIAIREDFGGIGMWYHQQDLIERLDHVLGKLDRGREYLKLHHPMILEDDIQLRKEQYGRLKRALLKVDRRTVETLTRTYLTSILSQ